MSPSQPPTLREFLADFDVLVEVGIGHRTDLSEALQSSGVSVTATDITDRTVPAGIDFAIDDVTDPDLTVYEGAEAIVAQNLPPELQQPTLEVAKTVDAHFIFTTLGTDPAIIPAEFLTLRTETAFVSWRKSHDSSPREF